MLCNGTVCILYGYTMVLLNNTVSVTNTGPTLLTTVRSFKLFAKFRKKDLSVLN